MVGKRVQFDDETWSAVDFLGRDKHRSFQDLADEAFRDLLAKHHGPVDLKERLRASAGKPAASRAKKAKPDQALS